MRGINLGHGYAAATYTRNKLYADFRTAHNAGYDIARIAQPTYNSSTATINMCKVMVEVALDVGFDEVHWGVVGGRPVTSAGFTAFANNVKTVIAPWAQDLADPRFHLGIGNEEELWVDGTTITIPTLQSNLKTLATEVQSIYTYGDIVYVTDATERVDWSTLGLGSIDRIGMNVYYGVAPSGDFKANIVLIASTFGSSAFISEWGIGGGYPTIEAMGSANAEQNFADNMLQRQQFIEASGLDHCVFGFSDGAFGVTADQWGLRTVAGVYRDAWYALTGVRKYTSSYVSATSTTTTMLDTKADVVHTHAISDIEATGTASSSTYLRGDGTWSTPAGGGAITSVNSQTGVVLLDTDDISDSGATNKYVTTAEKTKLSNLSGTNTGDQDLSSYATTSTVTSGLALKAPLASPTFTGTVSGITKSMVGLTDVDNTSDANKPVSTAQQAAIDLKANTSHTHAQSDITSLTSDLAAKATDTAVVHLAGTEDITGAKTFSSAIVASAGITAASTWNTIYTGGGTNFLNVSSGTAAGPVVGSIYFAQAPAYMNGTATGICFPVGTGATGTNKVVVALYSANGTLLANSNPAGTIIATTNAKVKVPFTTPYAFVGPGVYWIALQFDTTTSRYMTFALANEPFYVGSTTGTFGTLPSISPSTSYVTGVGPFASTY